MTVYDDFEDDSTDPTSVIAATLDIAEWQDQEVVREIRNDSLTLYQRREYHVDDASGILLELATVDGLNATKFEATGNITSFVNDTVFTATSLEMRYQPEATRENDSQRQFIARNRISQIESTDVFLYEGLGIGCANAGCTTNFSTGVFSFTPGSYPHGGEHTPASDVTLSLSYDSSVSEIAVTEGEANTGSVDVSGINADTEVNVETEFKEAVLRTRLDQLTEIGEIAEITVTWDDVRVNDVVYDTFGTDFISLGKWSAGELVREISSGTLRMALGASSASSNELRFRDPAAIQAIAASVQVATDSTTGSGNGRFQVGGFWYNDGSEGDAEGGYNGDIWAEIGVDGSEVFYSILRYVTADCETLEPFDGGSTRHVIAANGGGYNLLFMQWDGIEFTFQVNDNIKYTIDPTDVAPVSDPAPVQQEKLVGLAYTDVISGTTYLSANVSYVSSGAAVYE